MTTGNGGAAIGLANSNKLTPIGELVPNQADPRAGVSTYIGNDVSNIWWDHNAIAEDPGFLIPSCNEPFELQWVTTGGSPVTLGAESRVTATDGVIVADDEGDLTAFLPAGTVIPAGYYLWVESGAIPPIEFDSEDPIPDQDDLVVDVPYVLDISSHFVNGVPPKLFEIFSGSLPPGLTLTPGSGIVSGTPTTPGSSGPVVFKGTDGRGNSANSNGVPFEVAAAGGTIFITSGTTFVAPPGWTGLALTVECIGGGGGGAGYAVANIAVGGGGGAYSKALNVAVANGAPLQVGAGGTGGDDVTPVGGTGGDTWFNGVSLAASSCGAKGGTGGNATTGAGGVGGAAASGIGSTKTSGGNGGGIGVNSRAGGGGGGAGGALGNGGNGGAGGAGVPNAGGAGGGGANNGAAGGVSTTALPSGSGGNSGLGAGGGAGAATLSTNGAAGANGGGGGGGSSGSGGVGIAGDGGTGGAGLEWTTHGSGGGGGGGAGIGSGLPSSIGNGGAGGLYGGGGGGRGWNSITGPVSGNGAPGLIVITW